ncbi:MAG: hypothetical protein LBI45_09165 [Bacteroidales bacterium]|nr:hypothetical protein [Bacteroidales bacterium]
MQRYIIGFFGMGQFLFEILRSLCSLRMTTTAYHGRSGGGATLFRTQ